jgi:hypothetical protein
MVEENQLVLPLTCCCNALLAGGTDAHFMINLLILNTVINYTPESV